MWRIIKGLITGDFHLHKWEVVNTSEVNVYYSIGQDRTVFHDYECKCVHCGKMKCFRL